MIEEDKIHNEKQLIEALKDAVIESMIEEIRENPDVIHEDMVKTFMITIFDSPKTVDFVKAIGFAHFREDKEACNIINDFCGLLSDMRDYGVEKMK